MSSPAEAGRAENGRPEPVTPSMLRDWPLPENESSKYERGNVLVIGGARKTPGAALLAGLAALRVGAGRLTLAVADSVAIPLAVTVPEAGVLGLAETASGAVSRSAVKELADELSSADVVLIGAGLADADETRALLAASIPLLGRETLVALDAYALGVLPDLKEEAKELRGRLILTPNSSELERLLARAAADPVADAAEAAEEYGAVVSVNGMIASPDGRLWSITTGSGGLATSGSGDVLAGVIAGLWARTERADQAACWGTHLHAASGDRLAVRVGPTGFLARELLDDLPALLVELG